MERAKPCGFLVIDKPLGLSSFAALNPIKRALRQWQLQDHPLGIKKPNPIKVGHAGTLDPLASGILTVAIGAATKQIYQLQDADKDYVFTIRWGVATSTEDAEGEVVDESTVRPSEADILKILPQFIGTVQQVPSSYSAIKVDGQRAYSLARNGQTVALAARPVEIHTLQLVDMPDADYAQFVVTCGKGTYVRALARDLAIALGSCGHLSALRRTRVGPFGEKDAIEPAKLFDIWPDWAYLSPQLKQLPQLDDILATGA